MSTKQESHGFRRKQFKEAWIGSVVVLYVISDGWASDSYELIVGGNTVDMRIILASASPRRSNLLAQMGLSFEVIPSNSQEKLISGIPPHVLALQLAIQKAEDVASKIRDTALVIGADTIVIKDDRVLGKPKDEDEAYQMLMELQGQVHEVITGLAVKDVQNDRCLTDYEKTVVEMAALTPDEIKRYIKTGEPMDKAGAYGIQGLGGMMVRRISGCYYNVVGLPIHKLWTMLKQLGVEVLDGTKGSYT
jgi:septum formation protein